jgi:hypothetical protein
MEEQDDDFPATIAVGDTTTCTLVADPPRRAIQRTAASRVHPLHHRTQQRRSALTRHSHDDDPSRGPLYVVTAPIVHPTLAPHRHVFLCCREVSRGTISADFCDAAAFVAGLL